MYDGDVNERVSNKMNKITPYFSKLASRMVQSITPAFKALASHVATAKPVFQRAIQAASVAFTPAPQPAPVKAESQAPHHHQQNGPQNRL